ncbi:hypothetical protein QVD17_32590 [Tagetes erecta]|uniref:Uncharacterized protein n=1 Tax=Tagetes erecta TaxID=13708 RepID=A0AAD8NKN1_TARER|nr:hypothetical protein QVD17_32590 [Tagetes erecta]
MVENDDIAPSIACRKGEFVRFYLCCGEVEMIEVNFCRKLNVSLTMLHFVLYSVVDVCIDWLYIVAALKTLIM